MDLSNFKTDTTLEENGVWVDMGDGCQVLVARNGNKKHREAIQRLRRPYKTFDASGRPLPDDVAQRITVEAMAEAILLGWRGLKEAGREVPYTTETARRVLNEYRDFRDQVSYLAVNMETFRAQSLEAAVGNSSATSSGPSTTEQVPGSTVAG